MVTLTQLGLSQLQLHYQKMCIQADQLVILSLRSCGFTAKQCAYKQINYIVNRPLKCGKMLASHVSWIVLPSLIVYSSV